MNRCPTSGHWTATACTEAPQVINRRHIMAAVGDDWREVAVGSSRWHKHHLARAYGDRYEFRHERISRLAGDQASYRVLARRRATNQHQDKETA